MDKFVAISIQFEILACLMLKVFQLFQQSV